MQIRRMTVAALTLAILRVPMALAGCPQQHSSAIRTDSPYILSASIQDIMQSEIDPAADSLWHSVGTTTTVAGVVERHPRTGDEWAGVRHEAITLMEATNLLVMEGRQVVSPGGKLADEGAPGILRAADAQQAIDCNRTAFIQFAHALHSAGSQMLSAIDARDPQAMLRAGEALDDVCEACHRVFWYPKPK
jgi:hypothetical protein